MIIRARPQYRTSNSTVRLRSSRSGYGPNRSEFLEMKWVNNQSKTFSCLSSPSSGVIEAEKLAIPTKDVTHDAINHCANNYTRREEDCSGKIFIVVVIVHEANNDSENRTSCGSCNGRLPGSVGAWPDYVVKIIAHMPRRIRREDDQVMDNDL